MPAVPFYTNVSLPDYNSKFNTNDKKFTYQSDGGYRHIRRAWSKRKKVFDFFWKRITQAEVDTINAFIDEIGVDSFILVDPSSLVPHPITGVVTLISYTVRIIEDTFETAPVDFDGTETRYSARLLFEEV